MEKLNFSKYPIQLKSNENRTTVLDLIRKKHLVLTPEEWVRQHVLHFLITDMRYPKSLINVEKQIELNGTKKRYDIVVYRNDGSIFLIVECKAPKIKINQTAFDQIARYNLELNGQFLMVTNGLEHYYAIIDYNNQCYHFLKELPEYK